MEVDDSVLWSRARTGDSEAFGMLLSATHGRSTTSASAVSGTGQRPRISSRSSSSKPGGDWTSRFRTEGTPVAVWDRHQRREQSPPHRAPPRCRARARAQPSPNPSFADDSDQRVDDEEPILLALGLVARLPRREQEVFALCAWSELSYEDAAIALRIPVGTVRSCLSRARARLQELDSGSGHEEDRMQVIKEAVERRQATFRFHRFATSRPDGSPSARSTSSSRSRANRGHAERSGLVAAASSRSRQ